MQQPFFAIKQANEKVSTNKHKAKGLGQAFFPKGAGTVKTQNITAAPFCYIFIYLPPYICLYLSDTEKL